LNIGLIENVLLSPSGKKIGDWKSYAESGHFSVDTGGVMGGVLKTLLSWKTVMPRYANDELAEVFLDRGASLWALKTGQIGGELKL
jgi:predicted Abi (CAAX) family protease